MIVETAPHRPISTWMGSATFSDDRAFRFELRRWWVANPVRWAAWLMLNPSKAGAKQNDPTVTRCIDFTTAWGYDGLIVVNKYPLASSRPRDMWEWAATPFAGVPMHENLGWVKRAGREAALRVVAFGADGRDQPWMEQCVEAFGQPQNGDGENPALHCLGHTDLFWPLHPMARGRWLVPNDAQPQIWNREG